MDVVTEWLEMLRKDKPALIQFLQGHNGYRFRAKNENVFINSVSSMHGARPGDVLCEICDGLNEKASHIVLHISFKAGVTDEGLSGLVKQNFKVISTSDDNI